MAFCGKCGTKVDEGLKFCPECGNAMAEAPAQATSNANSTDFSAKVADINNTADSTASFSKEDIDKNKVMALFSYIIFLIPLLAAKDSPFARFHANQGLVLFLGAILSSVVAVIPILGWLIAPIMSLIITILAVIGIVNALNGKAKELPIIGKIKILK